MSNVMTELFREVERRIEARRNAHHKVPLAFPGEKRRPKLPTWPQQKPHLPVSDHRLRESHL
jgi:hypothetical protein